MKKNWLLSVLVFIIVISTSGCNLSFQNTNPTPFFPTPNYTMTALFSVDENMLTSTPQDYAVNTSAPQLPTIRPTEESTIELQPSSTPLPTEFQPTYTPYVPTATRTSEIIREGTWITGKYMATAPVFDSIWDEWEATKYPATYIVYGYDNWKNSQDLEGSFRVGWNDTYLYLAVKVYDDKYVQNATGENIYKGDSIELLFDTNLYGDLYSSSLSSDDYQIGISPGKGSINGSKEAYIWFPTDKDGSLSDVLISSSENDGIYRVEIGIPWKVFNVTPSSGQQFGFGLSVSDNDNTSENIQQSMVSNLAKRSLVNPTTWTVLTLSK
jgi:hypothetical protein